MAVIQAVSESGVLTHDAAREVLAQGLGGRFTGQRMLVLIPDHTPSMKCAAPWHAGMAYALGFMRAAMKMIDQGA